MGYFKITYFDASGSNLYATIICNGDSISGIATDGGKGDYDQDDPIYCHSLTNSVADVTRYTNTISSFSEATERFFSVRIYQRTTATGFLPRTDYLKAVQQHYYNGYSNNSQSHDFATPAKIEVPEYLGTFTPNGTIEYIVKYKTSDGDYNFSATDINQYLIYNSSNQIIQSGNITFRGDDGEFGGATIQLVSGNYQNGNYYIRTSGTLDNVYGQFNTYFNISSGVVVAKDNIHNYGCVTGILSSVTSTSELVTTLPASGDNFYNGQIFRLVDTANGGCGRIVSGYVGATRTVQLNKPLPFTPSTGVTVMIYPIGGEYNL